MAQLTVSELAEVVDAPVERLLRQMHAAGLSHDSAEQVVNDEDKQKLLIYTRHHYYSDQWQVLEERVGSATTADRQYVWGLRYVDDLVLRDRDTGSGNERLYSMQDDNWNVVAICNASAAAVQERYTYTPYGMVEFLNPSFGSIGSSGFTWNYLFTGRERDTESALQLNRNRYYHPRLGCWIARDPMGYVTGEVNLYRYVLNGPIDRTDPSGLVHIARRNENLRAVVNDFLNGGPADWWLFTANHPVSRRFEKHQGLAWVWAVYDALDQYCCCYSKIGGPSRLEQTVRGLYWATLGELGSDIHTSWGMLTEGAPYGDFGIQVVGSFDFWVEMKVDCVARTKSIQIQVYNTLSLRSLTRNPFTRQPLVRSRALPDVQMVINIYRSDTFP